MTLMIAVGKPRSSGQSLMAQTSLLSFLLSSYRQSVELPTLTIECSLSLHHLEDVFLSEDAICNITSRRKKLIFQTLL